MGSESECLRDRGDVHLEGARVTVRQVDLTVQGQAARGVLVDVKEGSGAGGLGGMQGEPGPGSGPT